MMKARPSRGYSETELHFLSAGYPIRDRATALTPGPVAGRVRHPIAAALRRGWRLVALRLPRLRPSPPRLTRADRVVDS